MYECTACFLGLADVLKPRLSSQSPTQSTLHDEVFSNSSANGAHEMRVAAMKAYLEDETISGLRKVASARSRPLKAATRGDIVYVLRKNRFGKVWREGPGVMVMQNGTSTWIVVRAEL